MMEQIISKYSQSIENDSKIPSSFAEVNVNFIKKKKRKDISKEISEIIYEHRCKSPHKSQKNRIEKYFEELPK